MQGMRVPHLQLTGCVEASEERLAVFAHIQPWNQRIPAGYTMYGLRCLTKISINPWLPQIGS